MGIELSRESQKHMASSEMEDRICQSTCNHAIITML
jgi:hypothetical protein